MQRLVTTSDAATKIAKKRKIRAGLRSGNRSSIMGKAIITEAAPPQFTIIAYPIC